MGNPKSESGKLYSEAQVEEVCARRVRQVATATGLMTQGLSTASEWDIGRFGDYSDITKNCVVQMARLGPCQALHLLMESNMPDSFANYVLNISDSERWANWVRAYTYNNIEAGTRTCYFAPEPLSVTIAHLKVRYKICIDVSGVASHFIRDNQHTIMRSNTIAIWAESRLIRFPNDITKAYSNLPQRAGDYKPLTARQLLAILYAESFYLTENTALPRPLFEWLMPEGQTEITICAPVDFSDELVWLAFKISTCPASIEIDVIDATDLHGHCCFSTSMLRYPATITSDKQVIASNRQRVLSIIAQQGFRVATLDDLPCDILSLNLNSLIIDYSDVDIRNPGLDVTNSSHATINGSSVTFHHLDYPGSSTTSPLYIFSPDDYFQIHLIDMQAEGK